MRFLLLWRRTLISWFQNRFILCIFHSHCFRLTCILEREMHTLWPGQCQYHDWLTFTAIRLSALPQLLLPSAGKSFGRPARRQKAGVKMPKVHLSYDALQGPFYYWMVLQMTLFKMYGQFVEPFWDSSPFLTGLYNWVELFLNKCL